MTAFLPPLPLTQALNGTFRLPPLDGTLALPEIYEWNAKHNPNYPLYIYAKNGGGVETLYWSDAGRAMKVAAGIIRKRIQRSKDSQKRPIVAILSPSDYIPYITVAMGIMRANYVVFPISPRNSPSAIAHLIQAVGISHFLVGQEQAMTDLANATFDILRSKYPSTPIPESSPLPIFQDLYISESENSGADMEELYDWGGIDGLQYYLHSSGSTAFPKPIAFNSVRAMQIGLSPFFGDRDLTGQIVTVHSVPAFHGMGFIQAIWSAYFGLVISAYEPRMPPTVPTPESSFESAKATNSNIIFCTPSFAEAWIWSRRPEYVSWLATRTGLLFGGGPMNKEVGDYITSQGVTIFNLYGSTECGIMATFLPKETGYDWEYFSLSKTHAPHFVPYDENTYELVIVKSPFCLPGIINTKVDGVDAYATSDLLMPHPTKPGYWKVFGRSDDQIMHSTGEKTNPGPLESMLHRDPHILAAVIFGRGRFQTGVIIEPRPEFKFDPADEIKLAEFRNMIWYAFCGLEQVNEYAPQHSRIFKEAMAKPSKPFTWTAKNTPRRSAIINEYADEIDTLYDQVEESTQSNIPSPASWDLASTIAFVRAVISAVMVHQVKDDDDIFHRGCDSLQATWIRNSLLRALRDSVKLDTRQISGNLVYNHPSIVSLASYVFELASGSADDTTSTVEYRTNAMREMVAKYTKEFPIPAHTLNGVSGSTEGDVVLVTGTARGLGCHILVQLASSPEISKVYALNRASPDGTPMSARQERGLLERGLDAGVLDNGKVVLLEGDLSHPNFGLQEATYNEMHRSVTHIIHNAWPVNFNMALSSFEPSVFGVRRLIDFALTSHKPHPPHLTYTSSIGVFENCSKTGVLPEARIPPELAVSSGYTCSKWVSEEILCTASEQTPLKVVVVRVGQICGGLDGAWNLAEWFPAMVQSATTLGVFPDDDGVVSFIPPELTAGALIDFRKASVESDIVHLVHPYPVSWRSIADAIASELRVTLVPYSEWVSKLKEIAKLATESTTDGRVQDEVELMRKMRALRLLPFFEGVAAKQPQKEAMRFNVLSTTYAVGASQTLKNASSRQLGADDSRRWISYWQKAGLWN
ncbi:uncharacterized protein FIBRA_06405 [Fibroporia radiculosa]|uniref:Polyketide synthase phosphopantetheine-binding domain-containing protein n=1 Tax=Fibroporia radiculosa TaxID=599839 RepID=J4GBE1_9APHY|nr:uncharacterized protein FIBRA_06405 [Fibroporia radiculosa]CCM04238.1 predicted protein [Fibroporia radiculosa]